MQKNKVRDPAEWRRDAKGNLPKQQPCTYLKQAMMPAILRACYLPMVGDYKWIKNICNDNCCRTNS